MAKIIKFLMEVRSELRKVVWPTRIQTIRYTALVVVFSIVVAVVLGATDLGLTKALEQIINK
jgi:preprotein translocase subunit SecE